MRSRAELQANATELASRLREILPSVVWQADVSTMSKTALKLYHARAGLLHRISDLVTAALSIYGEGQEIHAHILLRSLLETFALLQYLADQVEKAVKTGDFTLIDDHAMKILLGTGLHGEDVRAVRVGETITKLGKSIKHIGDVYGALCDLAHPNAAGCLLHYGKQIGNNCFDLRFDRSPSPTTALFTPEWGLDMLCGMLDAILESNDKMLVDLHEFTKQHERAKTLQRHAEAP